MASEPVKPYFTRFLRVLTFCLRASNGVVFCGNGVVNGVVGEVKKLQKSTGNICWQRIERVIQLIIIIVVNKLIHIVLRFMYKFYCKHQCFYRLNF